ncbi:hypothetical protein CYFUS_008879 [Cystobacter fuscus]|uniref:DUF4328 domain-containing protein n=2 Tax=Cystobacter fuscus TaxID=43 RepID=A0A250JHN2_9BACT|nr:hypothetical protein CYFUS_008879 [Cystobacter fuscus]
MTSVSNASPELRPLCPAHPETLEVKACERCGSYFCAHCVSSGGRCQECLLHYMEASPSSKNRAKRAVLSLRILAALGMFKLIVNVWGVILWDVVLPSRPDSRYVDIYVPTVWFVAGAFYVLLSLTAVACLMWVHAVVRQMNVWGANVGATPTWAVVCWFVPFVNLIKPLMIVRRIVEELGGRGLVAALKLRVWWGALLLSRILYGVLQSLMRPVLVSLLVTTKLLVEIGFWTCALIAVFLTLRILREVQMRLESRRNCF